MLEKDLAKYFVGADRLIDSFVNARNMFGNTLPTTYPPYNIVKTDENKYLVEMAVAGFGKQNLEIEIVDDKLIVKGSVTTNDEQNALSYLYKGIANRAFTREFRLADTIEFKNAELVNGMLKIWLENIIPESKKPRKIEIDSKELLTE